jgi:peroxiredoxin-like protein
LLGKFRGLIIMVSFQPRRYVYNTKVTNNGSVRGETSSPGNPPIKIALPENLEGPGGDWSPDELFIASAEACAMLTFFWLLKDKGVEIASYESETEGVSQITKGGIFRFTKITIKSTITLKKKEDKLEVLEAVKKLDDWCCVSNSTKADVLIEADIKVE